MINIMHFCSQILTSDTAAANNIGHFCFTGQDSDVGLGTGCARVLQGWARVVPKLCQGLRRVVPWLGKGCSKFVPGLE